jgi:chemotaxis protein methyltransferase CheR
MPPEPADPFCDGLQSITEAEFDQYRRFIFGVAGIQMSAQKQQLVASRLRKRLTERGFRSYGDYFRHLSGAAGESERQIVVDLLTTNETYFFREPAHFDFLRSDVLPRFRNTPLQVWSAACSSGEEVYSLAMLIADAGLGEDWQILGSDISQRMLARARNGLYPMERATHLPRTLLQKYCLKGVRSQQGMFLIDAPLRQHVRFESINLTTYSAQKAVYDLVFLRNVLIYFDADTKRDVVGRIVHALKPGGLLFVSHVESLHGVAEELEMIRPSIFRRRGRA